MARKTLAQLALLSGVMLILGACSGLSSEPVVIATLPPAPTTAPTRIAPQPTAAPQATEAATPAATAESAPATRIGAVSGKLTNRTAGAGLPKDAPVVLHIVDAQSNEITLNTTADAEGKFTFEDVPIQAERAYFVSTTYHDRRFDSAPVMGDPASPTLDLPLEISEITASADVLAITSMTVQYSIDEAGITVVQITRFTNSSDRVFSADTKTPDGRYTSVTFSLPAGAQIIRFANGDERYVVGEDGATITDTAPVLPGERHIVHVMYRLPYKESGIAFEQPIHYAVNGAINVLVAPTSISAQVTAGNATLTAGQPQVLGEQTYTVLNGDVVMPSGGSIRFAFNGPLSATSSTQSPAAPVLTANTLSCLFILGGVGLMAFGFVLVIREGRTRRPGEALRHKAHIDALTAEIAQLDERYAQHQIDKVRYVSRRRQLKSQLAALMGRRK